MHWIKMIINDEITKIPNPTPMMKWLKYPNLQNWRWRITSLFRDHQKHPNLQNPRCKTQILAHPTLLTQMGNQGEQRRCMKLQVSLALTGSLCDKKLPLMLPKCLWDKPFIVLEVSEFLGRTKVGGGMSHDHAWWKAREK
jgi:hypothetical protein